MKIKKLTIHNIASIADAVIDFDGDVLGKSDLFLIYGDTGAGKSVILDCICLVLFNDAPRLRTEMEGKTDSESFNGGLTLKDPRQMLRRGAGEGFAELVFQGNDGVEYKGIWSSRRAGNKPDGKFQAVRRVIEWNGGVAEKSEVNFVVRKAVGMDMLQFQRTTMLAQGQFSMFLNSKDKDRAELLGKLLDVGVYNEISIGISRRLREENMVLESLNAEAGAVRPLTPEELAAIRMEIEQNGLLLEQLRKMHANALMRSQWFVTLSRINAQLALAREGVERARAILQQPAYTEAKKICAESESSSSALAALRERDEAKVIIRDCRTKGRRYVGEFRLLLAGVNSLRVQHLQNSATIAGCQSFLDSCSDKVSALENADALIEKLNRLAALQSKIIKSSESIPNLHAATESRRKEMEAAARVADDECKSVEELQGRVEESERNLKLLALDEIRTAVNSLTAREGSLRLLQRDFESMAEKKKELTDLRNSLSEVLNQLPIAARELAVAVASEKSQVEALASLEDSFGKASESLSDWARVARAQLNPGDLCPVCRRPVIDHIDSDNEILAALQPLKNDIEARRLQCESARKATRSAQIGHSLLTTKAEELKALVASKSQALEHAAAAFADSLSSLNVSESGIASELEGIQRSLAVYSVKLDEGAVAQKALADLRSRLVALHKKKDEAASRLLQAQRIFEQSHAAEKVASDLLVSYKDSFNVEVGQLCDALGNWSVDFSADPEAFAKILSSLAKDFVAAKKEIENLTSVNKTIEVTFENVREPINYLSKIFGIEASEISESRPTDGIETKFGNLAALTRSNFETIERCEHRLNEAKDFVVQWVSENACISLRRLFELYGFSDQKIQNCSEIVLKAEKGHEAAVSALFSVEEMMRRHCSDKPSMPDEANAESSAKDVEEISVKVSDCSAALGALRQRLQYDEDLRVRKSGLLNRIEAQKDVVEKWERLDRLFGSSDGKKFGTIALRYILGHLLGKANIYLRQIMPRYSLCCQRDSLLIMVRDAYLNGAMRPANSISGGETFIVSLALALALSDVGNRFNMDILFIDEGFGSLSGEPLEAAVDMLRGLRHVMGRRVGIISHVAELRERIPARIRVDRGAAYSTVSIEHD